MISGVLALIHTLFQIVLLRKGPEALPRSNVLLFVCLCLWIGAGIVVAVVLYEFKFRSLAIDMIASAVGLVCYVGVVVLYAKKERLQQMLAALLGCGAILAVTYTVVSSVLAILSDQDQAVAVWLVLGLLLWSVLLEGNILARTIDSHWYFGIAVAVAVVFLQIYIGSAMSPAETVAA